MNRPPTAVGLTQRLVVHGPHRERRLALDVAWARFLASCGIVGVPLPLDPELADRTVAATGCRAVVLTGGDDLAVVGGATADRDALEGHLLARALRDRTPLIGVCRGMQLILHTLGARLVGVSGHAGRRHEITGGRTVNSFHNWAVLDVPSSVEVTARAGDVVESVHLRDRPIAGIMWHPERDDPFDRRDINLFSDLLREAA